MTLWYSIKIFKNGGNSVFYGYFHVNVSTNSIDLFYNALNEDVNILLPGNDYGADNKFIQNTLTYEGTAIQSIPGLDVEYGAVEWSLQVDTYGYHNPKGSFALSYKNEIGVWHDLLNYYSMKISIPTYKTLNNYYHTFYTMSAASPTILTRTIYDNTGTLQRTQDISFGGMTIADVLSLLDGSGTNPYTIGTIDASVNRISMDLAYCNVYTQALTSATQQRIIMTDVNTKYKEPHTAATITYIVTVSGDAFWLSADGGVSTNLTPLYVLEIGEIYVFDQSDFSNSGYPLTINTDINNTVRYTPGVLMNGTPGSLNAYTLIDLSNSDIAADTKLYYGVHGSTGGILYISNPITATTTYIVTVSEDAFWLSSDGGVSTNLTPSCFLLLGEMYVFDQSDFSNSGYPLTINTDINNTVRYSPGVGMNGTPGYLNAYTLIDLSNSGIAVDTTLYYGVNGSAGGILHTSYPLTTYVVTVSGGVFWLNNLRQLPMMISGSAYLFDQSDSTNSGNTLVLGASLDSSSYYSSGVTTNGTAGSSGAYTYLSYSGQYQTLSCYSSSTNGMGLIRSLDASIVSTTSGVESVTIVVTATHSITGETITGYIVTTATFNGGTYYPLSTLTTSTSSTIIVSGLAAGTSYYFKVRAQNSIGDTGLFSAYTTVAAIPYLLIDSFKVVGVGSNCFTCTWKTPTYAVTTYRLVYDDGTNVTTVNFSATSLTKNVQYGYSGYTLKNIVDRPIAFHVSLTDANSNSDGTRRDVSNIRQIYSPVLNENYTTSTMNSFTLIRFTSSVLFTTPKDTSEYSVRDAAVIVVGKGGDGNSTGGSSGAPWEAGGGSGGGVAFYPLYSTFSAWLFQSIQITIGTTATSFQDKFMSVSAGNNGSSGTSGTGSGGGAGGSAVSKTIKNSSVTFTSGAGGSGQNQSNGTSSYCASTNGVNLVIPEMDISYNFSGGGGGGIANCTDMTMSAFVNLCNARNLTYGGGIGGHSAGTDGTPVGGATAGTAYTGGGGGGCGEQETSTGAVFTGGSGVVYLYYSTFSFGFS
jgi:hypothetical protein